MWVCTEGKVDAFLMEFQHSVNARSFNIKKEMLSYCFDISIQNLYSAEASLASILQGYDATSFAQLDLRRYCHSSLQNLLRSTSVGRERDCLWTLESHFKVSPIVWSFPWIRFLLSLTSRPIPAAEKPSAATTIDVIVQAMSSTCFTSEKGHFERRPKRVMINLLECSPNCSQGSAIGFLVTFLI